VHNYFKIAKFGVGENGHGYQAIAGLVTFDDRDSEDAGRAYRRALDLVATLAADRVVSGYPLPYAGPWDRDIVGHRRESEILDDIATTKPGSIHDVSLRDELEHRSNAVAARRRLRRSAA